MTGLAKEHLILLIAVVLLMLKYELINQYPIVPLVSLNFDLLHPGDSTKHFNMNPLNNLSDSNCLINLLL